MKGPEGPDGASGRRMRTEVPRSPSTGSKPSSTTNPTTNRRPPTTRRIFERRDMIKEQGKPESKNSAPAAAEPKTAAPVEETAHPEPQKPGARKAVLAILAGVVVLAAGT